MKTKSDYERQQKKNLAAVVRYIFHLAKELGLTERQLSFETGIHHSAFDRLKGGS